MSSNFINLPPGGIPSVPTASALPLTGSAGQIYVATDTGAIYAWSTISSGWVEAGTIAAFAPTQGATFTYASPSYINVGTTVNTGWTTAFSLSFWANLADNTHAHVIFDNYTSSAGKGIQIFFDTASKLNVSLNGSNGTGLGVHTTSATGTIGTWEHWLVTYDGGKLVAGTKVYKNGTSAALTTDSNNLSADFLSATNTYLGVDNFPSPNSYFNGSMCQVADFIGIALSSSQAGQLYDGGQLLNLGQFGSAPTAWWQLNGNVIDTQAFANGTAHNITYTSSIPPVDTSAPSYANRYLANLSSPLSMNQHLTFQGNDAYSIGDSASTGRPSEIFLPGALSTAVTRLQIGDPYVTPVHYYPLIMSSNVPDAMGSLQIWAINSNSTNTTGAYSGFFVGQDRSSNFGSINFLNSQMTPASVLQIESAASGGLSLIADAGAVRVAPNGTNAWQWNTNGHFIPYASGNYDIGNSTLFLRAFYCNSQALGYQRVASAASAGSTTISNNINTLVLHAGGTLTSYTVTMPAAPLDGQIVAITCNNAITIFTLSGNSGQTVVGAPSALSLGSGLRYQYVLADTAWYPV